MFHWLKSRLPVSSRSFYGKIASQDLQLTEIREQLAEIGEQLQEGHRKQSEGQRLSLESRQLFSEMQLQLTEFQKELIIIKGQLEEKFRQQAEVKYMFAESQRQISKMELQFGQQLSELKLQLTEDRLQLSEIHLQRTQQLSEMQLQLAESRKQLLEIQQQMAESRLSQERLESALSTINYKDIIRGVQWSISTAFLHQASFFGYKNKYVGKTVVLCGAAKSLNYYKPIDNAIHVALNRAFLFDKVKFDYIFVQDFDGVAHVAKELREYKGNNCVKFFGTQNGWKGKETPELYAKQCGAIRFNTDLLGVSNNLEHSEFAYDISTLPLGNFYSVAFPALQFIMYTNPQKIYIVGNDFAPTGYFNNLNKTQEQIAHEDDEKIIYWTHEYIWRFWMKFRDFAATYYPDTEIISVNPVALKGMFKDEFTT